MMTDSIKEKISKCKNCSDCLPACPSYMVSGDERDSPRGRIRLAGYLLHNDGNRDENGEIAGHLNSCLGCMACMEACGNEVDYAAILIFARQKLQLPSAYSRQKGNRKISKTRGKNGRIAMIPSCRTKELDDTIADLLQQAGVGIVDIGTKMCCGALCFQACDMHRTEAIAKANVKDLVSVISTHQVEAIATASPGCAHHIRLYGKILQNQPEYVLQAEKISNKIFNIYEFLLQKDLNSPALWSNLAVIHHKSCMAHNDYHRPNASEELLRKAGFSVAAFPEAGLCCGGINGYDSLQPAMAKGLNQRTAKACESLAADIIACDSTDCIDKLSKAADIPVVHTLKLINWALGGPEPSNIRALANRVRP
jgi:glycolate oxidase iron-sulfur subunit